MATLLFAQARLQAVAAALLVLFALQVVEAAGAPRPPQAGVRMALLR